MESHLRYVDPWKGDYEELGKNLKLYNRTHACT